MPATHQLSSLMLAVIGFLFIVGALRRMASANEISWQLFRSRHTKRLIALAAVAIVLRLLGL